ncbi:hypothetical protein HS088_TW13G00976 [Tripterygium wilfordii]|uniref:Uncharacterized protein n=1 Tax=Tripterygium wilfordii TaxID=458696 RepID=A0A7J7CVI9_TRIWF|nr:hypothetical protein HS088_TW13G00976 [Tripterygium wilfordii]
MKKLILTGLSVDGDSQGVERLFVALSDHMWPGMVLKSGYKITEPSLPEKEDVAWVSSNDPNSVARNDDLLEGDPERGRKSDKEDLEPSTSKANLQNESENRVLPDAEEPDKELETNEWRPFDFEDL